MGHGEPVEGEEDVLDAGEAADAGAEVGKDEVGVVGQPTHAENL